jgi:cytochrome c2
MRTSASLVASLSVAAALSCAGSGAAVDGKETFLAQKCDMCHAVSSAGIEATTKSEKMKGPDLKGVVAKLDPVWVADFIQKKVDKAGKKHVKEFKGTAEELTAVVEWLKTQN